MQATVLHQFGVDRGRLTFR